MDFAALLAAIAGGDKLPKHSDLVGLSSLTPAEVEQFKQAMTQAAEERRIELASRLAELAEDQTELDLAPAMVGLTSDPSAGVRRLAVSSLWESADPATVRLVLKIAQSDPNVEVREAALLSLASYALAFELGQLRATVGQQLKDALIKMVNDEDEPLVIRRRALEAIGVFNEKPVRDLIRWGFAHPDREVKASAVYAMGRSADRFWLPEVMQSLSSAHTEIRFEAVRAAGGIELEEAVPTLVRFTTDDDREIVAAAVNALAEIATDEAERALTQLAGSEDEFLREIGEEGLENLRTYRSPLEIGRLDR